MVTHDNGPKPPDWQPQIHCGVWCETLACEVCGEWVPRIPPTVELGEN